MKHFHRNEHVRHRIRIRNKHVRIYRNIYFKHVRIYQNIYFKHRRIYRNIYFKAQKGLRACMIYVVFNRTKVEIVKYNENTRPREILHDRVFSSL